MVFNPLSRITLNRKKLQILLIAVCVLLFGIAIYRYSLHTIITGNLVDAYLTFVGQTANWLLNILNSKYSISGHEVYYETGLATAIDSNYLLLKRTLVLIAVCWITPSKAVSKLSFTGLILLVNMLGSVVNIVVAVQFIAHFADVDTIRYIGRLPFELLLLSLLIIWIRLHRENLFRSKFAKKYRLDFLDNNLRRIIIAIAIYIVLSNILLGFFKYTIWINFLFSISAWILNLLNYPAWVESHLLVGENYSIHMARGCLGLNTMMLFTLMVYITGKNNRTMWLFIFVGVIILNLSNISRFVLLFIHLQNHGQYVLSVDIHDLYNYVIYGIVFLLWIIWFEKYSYIKREKKRVKID